MAETKASTINEFNKDTEIFMNKKVAYDSVYNRYIKRFIDVVITGITLCILWPFYLIISLAIYLEDGFPVFYRADRGGYKGRKFRICKFRLMVKTLTKLEAV